MNLWDFFETTARRAAVLLLVGVCLCVATCAHADTMAIVQTGCNAGDSIGKCTGGSYKKRPAATDLVRMCPTSTAPQTPASCWSAGEPRVGQYSAQAAGMLIDACTTAGVVDLAKIPYPWSATGDPCKTWVPTDAAAFGKPVNQSGRFQITWSPPTQNTDGSALTDLAGYWIYSAASGASLGKLQQVKSPTATSVVLTGYGPGIYDFAASAYNAAGVESGLSAAISIEVKPGEPKVPNGPSAVKAQQLPETP